MRFGIGILLLTLLVLAAGCQQAAQKAAEGAAERAIEAQSDGKVSADISGDTVKITDAETGEETIVKTGKGGQSMPEGWPAKLPKYPNSTVISSMSFETPEGKAYHIALHSSATSRDVADFYVGKAEAAGYKKQTEMETPEGVTLAFESATKAFVVTAVTADGGCDASLQLMPK